MNMMKVEQKETWRLTMKKTLDLAGPAKGILTAVMFGGSILLFIYQLGQVVAPVNQCDIDVAYPDAPLSSHQDRLKRSPSSVWPASAIRERSAAWAVMVKYQAEHGWM